MKQFKKVLALVLALALAMSLSLPVFAEGETNPDQSGTEQTGETGGGSGDSNQGSSGPQSGMLIGAQNVTINGISYPYEMVANGENPVNVSGRDFVGYQIFKGEWEEVDGQKVLTEVQWGSAITNPTDFLAKMSAFSGITYDENYPNRSADAAARVVAGWDSNSEGAMDFARAVDAYLDGEEVPFVADGTPNMPAGFYLVVDESEIPDDAENYARNLSVLYFGAGATFDPQSKVSVPSLEKKVLEFNDSDPTNIQEGNGWKDVADYDIGDVVPFSLTGTLPEKYDNFAQYKYVMHDTLSEGLTLNLDSVRVFVAGNPAAEDTYTVGAEGEDSLTVTFANLKESYSGLNAGDLIRVVYTATLNEDAVHGNDSTSGNRNTAYLEFSNDPNYTGDGDDEPTGTTPKDIVTVFTFDLVTKKVDGDNEPLNGATFALYKVVGEEQILIETIVGENKSTFTFGGLDAGDYMLREEDAPAGYNKAEDMYFTITAGYNDETPPSMTSLKMSALKTADGQTINGSAEIAGDITTGTVETPVVNLKGVVLPSTGGIGTTIFYLVGGLCVAAAVVLLITKKRMGKAE